MPKPGTIVYALTAHPIPKMERLAKARGWNPDEKGASLFDYVEPEQYGETSEFADLNKAVDAAKFYLARQGDVFGCANIEKRRYEEDQDMPGIYEWATIRTYEVDETGITSDW